MISYLVLCLPLLAAAVPPGVRWDRQRLWEKNQRVLDIYRQRNTEGEKLVSSLRDLPMDQYVKFFLYTRSNQLNYEELVFNDTDSVAKSDFDGSHHTTFIVHGFMSNYQSQLFTYTVPNLLKDGEENVVVVDWSAIAMDLLYNVVAEETPQVGNHLAAMIQFLQREAGLQLSSTHLIGHSLGAHIVGFAGKALGGLIPRITGLDPAKPGFEDAGPDDRLDKSDAQFVDCIHTDSGEYGLGKPVCHADFYPNGGQNFQPGCPWFDIVGSCSHGRAYLYYAESLEDGHQFLAMTCTEVPLDGPQPWCLDSQALMGAPASPDYQGLFYVSTNGAYPFAQS